MVVVNRMRKMKTLPTLDEGFSRVTICRSDDDYNMALRLYSNLGQDSQLEDGFYSGSTSNKDCTNPGAKRKAPDVLQNGTKEESEGGFSRATRPRNTVKTEIQNQGESQQDEGVVPTIDSVDENYSRAQEVPQAHERKDAFSILMGSANARRGNASEQGKFPQDMNSGNKGKP